MKTNILKIVVVMLVLVLAGVSSCQSKSEADQPKFLKGTKWKLVGIVDETGSLKELELQFGCTDQLARFHPCNRVAPTSATDFIHATELLRPARPISSVQPSGSDQRDRRIKIPVKCVMNPIAIVNES